MLLRTLLPALLLCLLAAPLQAVEPRLAIIIDDIGYSAHYGERSARLPGPITLAVLPHTPHGPRLATLAHTEGKEVILHIPMSNSAGLPLDAGGLDGAMEHADFVAVLRDNLAQIPHIRGANNHMGSQLTQEAEPMSWLMGELYQRQLFFVDSRTSAASLAHQTALARGVPSAERDVFLDNERDPEAIRQQLARAVRLAQQEGQAIAIGHPYPETLQVLEQWLAAPEPGLSLVPVSALLQSPPARSRAQRCLAPPPSLWYRPPGVDLPSPEQWLPLLSPPGSTTAEGQYPPLR